MKTWILVGCLFVAGIALSQTRVVTFDATLTQVEGMSLRGTADGGCIVVWTGTVMSADGISNRVFYTAVLTRAALITQCQGFLTAGQSFLNQAGGIIPDGGQL